MADRNGVWGEGEVRTFVQKTRRTTRMLGGVAEGSREDREKRYGPTQNAAMRSRPETPKTKRCAVARKETMRCRFAPGRHRSGSCRGSYDLGSHPNAVGHAFVQQDR